MHRKCRNFVAVLCVLFAWSPLANAVEYRFYHPDTLGSNVVVTNRAGAIVQRTVPSPYGALPKVLPGDAGSVSAQETRVRPLFTDQEFDPESELHYFGARFYDPAVGRFLANDPELALGGISFARIPNQPGNLNGHSYALNRPTVFVDPTGAFVVGTANVGELDPTQRDPLLARTSPTPEPRATEFPRPEPTPAPDRLEPTPQPTADALTPVETPIDEPDRYPEDPQRSPFREPWQRREFERALQAGLESQEILELLGIDAPFYTWELDPENWRYDSAFFKRTSPGEGFFDKFTHPCLRGGFDCSGQSGLRKPRRLPEVNRNPASERGR